MSSGAGESLAQIAEHWLADFRGNVLTVVLLTEALLPRMRRLGGRILAMSSIAGVRGPGAYGAAKAALHAWAFGLAAQLGPDGITVTVVAPGFVPDTEFWEGRLRRKAWCLGWPRRWSNAQVRRRRWPKRSPTLRHR